MNVSLPILYYGETKSNDIPQNKGHVGYYLCREVALSTLRYRCFQGRSILKSKTIERASYIVDLKQCSIIYS